MTIEFYRKYMKVYLQITQLKIARELEVNVGHRPVHGGVAIKTHRKITYLNPLPCCCRAQKHVALWLNLYLPQVIV